MSKPKIALWFRYGPAEHAELFHAIPDIVASLAQSCEVHYFGLKSTKPIPEKLSENALIHHLPFRVNRLSQTDKFVKTALWLLALPWIGLYCRMIGIRAVYIDETIPLSALLARMFFGNNVAITVADFFVDIYSHRHLLLRPVASCIRRIDLASWRLLPLIFTRAKATRQYLSTKGIEPSRIHPVYDPCDFSIYHPADRRAAKEAFGLNQTHVVLVHHGILHPNKGNDLIIQALAPLKNTYPHLRFLLIGDGPEMSRLKLLVRELGLDETVLFTGWLPSMDRVNMALNAGDIGLVMRTGQTADHFHITGALVHSMACGLPILAARLAGISEIVEDGICGYLFDPNDMEEFQAQLLKLVHCASLRQRFGDAALALANKLFNMEHVTKETCESLLNLVSDLR